VIIRKGIYKLLEIHNIKINIIIIITITIIIIEETLLEEEDLQIQEEEVEAEEATDIILITIMKIAYLIPAWEPKILKHKKLKKIQKIKKNHQKEK